MTVVRDFAFGVGIVCLIWLAWGQATAFEFVEYDDNQYVSENSRVSNGFQPDSLKWAVQTGHTGNWIPLVWLSLMLDAELFGLDAGAFHRTNLILHSISSVVLYLALRTMTAAPVKSLFVAALFAVHPIHVESVVWISERKDSLSTVFGMMALWAYARYAQQPGRGEAGRKWLLVSLVTYGISLLSKQMLVTLPFLLLLLDFWPLRRIASLSPQQAEQTRRFPPQTIRALLLEKIPYLVLMGVFIFAAYEAQSRGFTVSTFERWPLSLRIQNAIVVYGLYAIKMVWPINLAVFYPLPGVGEIPLWEMVVSGGSIVALLIAGMFLARRQPHLLIGLLWYLGTLVPVIGIVQIGLQRMADRYTYFPSIGLCIAAIWTIDHFAAKLPSGRSVATVIGTVAMAAITYQSHIQASYWANTERLFHRSMEVTGPHPIGHQVLGRTAYRNGQLETAETHYLLALELQSDFGAAHFNYARLLQDEGRFEESRKHYTETIRVDPNSVETYFNLGNLYVEEAARQSDDSPKRRELLQAAVDQFRAGLEIDETYAEIHNNLANALQQLGQQEDAFRHYRLAVEHEPKNIAARVNYGIALHQQQASDEAIYQFRQALLVDPNHFGARRNLAAVLSAVGQFAAAAEEYRAILDAPESTQQLHQELAETYANWGAQQAGAGNFEAAVKLLQDALTLNNELWKARFNLAQIFLLQKNLTAAEQALVTVIEQAPEFAEAHNLLGEILARQGKLDEAITTFEKALELQPDLITAQRNLKKAQQAKSEK